MKSKFLVALLGAILALSACGTTQEAQQLGKDTTGTAVGTGSGTNNNTGTGTSTGTQTDTSTIKTDTITIKTDTTRK